MLSLDIGFVCIFVGFAHLIESRVLILSEFEDDPFILDHIEKTSQEELRKQPIFYEPKRTRNSKKTVVKYGRHIYNLDNYKDSKEVRSKLKPDSISYDYIEIDKLIDSSNTAKSSVRDSLNNVYILSDTPLRLCYERQCEGDLRKSSDDDDTDWKHKKMPLPLGHMKRFQIVDNKHNLVRDSKFGSGESKGKKKAKKHKKHSSESEESKESGSKEKNSGRTHKKKKTENSDERKQEDSDERKQENSDETDTKPDSASASFEKWKNHENDSKSVEDIPKKKTKKKQTKEPEDTKRKTIPVEDTFFMQGNKIYHSTGKSKKRHDDLDRRRRLEHFMPKRYHWEPSEIHQLGYYWFNGPKGLYPEPRPLSI